MNQQALAVPMGWDPQNWVGFQGVTTYLSILNDQLYNKFEDGLPPKHMLNHLDQMQAFIDALRYYAGDRTKVVL